MVAWRQTLWGTREYKTPIGAVKNAPKKTKDKDRFLKIVYYKEPSKAALKKLQKIQESSSDDESSDEEHANQNVNQTTTEDDYYRLLARQFFNWVPEI